MNIAIIGYGRMGHAVERAAEARGHRIVARIDPEASGADFAEISAAAVADAEICVEFTLPGAVVGNLLRLLELGRPVVTGTTGWQDRLAEVRTAIERTNGTLLHGPNFSIGVNLLFHLTKTAAALFNRFEQYDPYVWEMHHSGKADSPSGTAVRLAEIVQAGIPRKTRLATGSLDRRIALDELSVASVRAGGAPGSHTVGFDGPFDSLTLTHVNRDRESLAQGAILALEWLAGRSGFYDFNDALEDLLRTSPPS
jgi:4-hydroxy-tetrahydrodipicolinate reductase